MCGQSGPIFLPEVWGFDLKRPEDEEGTGGLGFPADEFAAAAAAAAAMRCPSLQVADIRCNEILLLGFPADEFAAAAAAAAAMRCPSLQVAATQQQVAAVAHPATPGAATPGVVPQGAVPGATSLVSSAAAALSPASVAATGILMSHQNQNQVTGCVMMVYGLDPEKMTCDRLFNMFCLYGNVIRDVFWRKPVSLNSQTFPVELNFLNP
ncbi:unnamed protein product [Notodromas monacha]|uniref:RRM domain-containing protein n=1 Tax=Notodromas monacha TaxID=399045 RepID=A0A7R9GKJ5_9CRUS|nr:unnamed protein product [Notodromas monacha]CAG0923983.1 unnamed protein product [Notodromas monacha]